MPQTFCCAKCYHTMLKKDVYYRAGCEDYVPRETKHERSVPEKPSRCALIEV